MTLDDYARVYAAHCARRTIRPFLGWRIRNAANSNSRAMTFLPVRAAGPVSSQTGPHFLLAAASEPAA